MSLAILSAPDTHGVNLRAHGERPREVGHRESRAWLAAPSAKGTTVRAVRDRGGSLSGIARPAEAGCNATGSVG